MKKPWPADAMMVVAPNEGDEIRHPDFPTTLRSCRDCGRVVCVRLASIERLESHPGRKGRPVDFFCIGCATRYDPNSMDELIDMRTGE